MTITDETIIKTCVKTDGTANPNGYKDEAVKEYLRKRYDDIPADMFTFAEVVQRVVKGIDKRPVCEICGGPVKYVNRTNAMYTEVCSKKCSNAISKLKMIEIWANRTPDEIQKIQEKTKKSCIDRFGVEYSFQSQNNKDKSDATRMEKYGDKNYGKFGSNSFKQKMTEKYGYEHPQSSPSVRRKISESMSKESAKEKMKSTVMARYGVEHVSQSSEIQRKINESYSAHGTYNTSSDEEILMEILSELYGSENVERGYMSPEYPFKCDFYIKSVGVYVEYQGSMFHNLKLYDPAKDRKEMLRLLKKCSGNSKPNRYDNLIQTWTERDVRKWDTAETAKLKMLFLYPMFHEKWLYYKSHADVRNGELRVAIKDKLKELIYNTCKPTSVGEKERYEQKD